MATRRFEAKEHTKLYKKYRQLPPPQLIQRVMEFLKEKYNGELNLTVDVGCGSGQNTFSYAKYFKNVIGIDISPNQVKMAQDENETKNVFFQVSPAEKMDLDDGSVQLLTAMAAAHWFDLPTFFEEAQRVLCPSGVLAVYMYGALGMQLKWERDPSKNDDINNIYKRIYLEDSLVEYWTPEMRSFLLNYRDITIPMEDFVRDEETYFEEKRVSLAYFTGQVRSWSAFQKMTEARGEDAADEVIDAIQSRFMKIIKEDLSENEKSPEDIYFIQKTSYALLMARKSSK